MKHFLSLVLVVFLSFVTFGQETIDRIVAIVGDEIILESEILKSVQWVAMQNKISPDDPKLKRQVLNELINEKLMFEQAILDSIEVADEEANRQADMQLQTYRQQFGSDQKIEEAFGLSIEKIRREIRESMRKNLMVQQLRQKEFGMLEASRREVREFFDTYKDSLGVIPEKVEIAHIFRYPRTPESLKEKYYDFANDLLDSLKNGADFAELAKKYSEDPGSKSKGGDLGSVKRGVFYPEYESAAFALNEGELSGVIESPAGYHIIELLDKRGESIHTRHILIQIKADEEADLSTITFLSDIRDSIQDDVNSFSYYAKKYSDDKETASFGGDLGSFYLGQLQETELETISKLDEGEISFPKRFDLGGNKYGYRILYLKKRIPQHQPDLEIDYIELKNLADRMIQQEKYQEWIEDLKENIYWDIKVEEYQFD